MQVFNLHRGFAPLSAAFAVKMTALRCVERGKFLFMN
jgi:hypothetical protein